MSISDITQKLSGVKRSQYGFIAKCPAHEDGKQSLSIGENGGKVLVARELAIGSSLSVTKAHSNIVSLKAAGIFLSETILIGKPFGISGLSRLSLSS